MPVRRMVTKPLLAFLAAAIIHAQTAPSAATLSERALHEFRAGKFSEAERDFREIAKRDASNIYAQFYLGQTFFKEEKYADAVGPYERARTLEKSAKVLSSDQRRIVTDQLVMAYGISGQLKKARELLDDVIPQDPEYPMNYYNLACAFAEEGNKGKMLANLDLAFQHKDHVLKGEQMPDPRSDSSFQKYLQDDDFLKLMKKLGFE
jgi:predicted Zn-dependent protease